MPCREQILSDDYAEILLDYTFTGEEEEFAGFCFEVIDDQFVIVYVPRELVQPISVTTFTYNSLPKLYGLMQEIPGVPSQGVEAFDPISLIRTGILQLQRPPLSLTGKGVVIGFIDTGIQYDLDVFRREDGSSRILAIWDQTIHDGQPPAGFSYGTEYTNAQINEALRSGNPLEIVPSTDTNGHGTAMASVAAGSSIDDGTTFVGAAPDADIVIVKCREAKQYLRDYYYIPDGVPAYSEADIGMATKYIEGFTRVGDRPVVICLGLGTNWGDHAGNSILSQYLNRIADKRNRAVIVCGGNEGNAGHHFNSIITMRGEETTETVELRVGEPEAGFLMELWGSVPNTFRVSIRSPGGEIISPIDFRARETRNFSFIYEKTKISIAHILVEQGSGEELVIFRFTDPTPGVWTFTIIVRGDSDYSAINMWLPITQFMQAETYFLRSTPYITLTEPSLAEYVITPSTYNDSNNSFFLESGRGFSRDEIIKPDFAAPGVDVSTILGKRSGSSLSAAITAGGTAQVMQWAVIEGNEPLAQSSEIKTYFIRGAVRSTELVYPNRSWGYGRLDVARAFEIIARSFGE